MEIGIELGTIIFGLIAFLIVFGKYKEKLDAHDKKFDEIEEKFDDISNKQEKMWSKIDKLTEAVYEIKNYIKLIATCFKMEIKDDKED